MLYIIISMIVLFVSFFLFKRASGTMSITKLNIISFNYYYQLILQAFVGVNIVILGLDSHYLLNRITDFSIKQTAYFSVVFVLIAMPLSMLFISFIARFNSRREWITYTNKDIKSIISKDDKAVFVTLTIFTFISFLSIAYTFLSIGTIPLFQMLLNSSAEQAARLRIIASTEFGGVVYIRNVFGLTMTPILSYIAYTYTFKSKYIGWRILFVILALLSLIILTYSGAKAPVLMYIFSFIFLQVLISGKINLKKMLTLVLVVIVVLVGFYISIMNYQLSFFDINNGPLGRIFLGQIASLYFHFMYFPEVIPFLDGHGFPGIIAKLFNFEAIRSSRIIMELVNPASVQAGTAGVMNTLFIGEAYANYGWSGLILGTIYVGFCIQIAYILLLRLPKNPLIIAFFVSVTLKIPLTGGFFDFIYNPGIILTIVILISFYLIALIIHKLLIGNKFNES